MLTMKLAGADGKILWLDFSGGADRLDDVAWSIAVGPDGHPVTTGVVQHADGGASFLTIKRDAADGSQLWERQSPGAVAASGRSGWVAVDAAGDVIMANRVWSAASSYDVFAQKYSGGEGEILWTRQYHSGGNRADDLRAMRLAADGAIVIAGRSHYDYLALKLRGTDGQVAWAATYDGPPGWYDEASCIAFGPAGEVIVSGFSDGGVASGWDIAIVGYDSDSGQRLWSTRYDGPDHGAEEAAALAVSPQRDLYVAGYSYRSGRDMDLLAVRYGLQAPAAAPAVAQVGPVLAAHPNPFNPRVALVFDLDEAGPVRLEIFDARGRRVARAHDGPLPAGRHRLIWDGRTVSGAPAAAGAYLARLTTAGGEDIRALALVR